MALVDASTTRVVREGFLPCKVLLAEAVMPGDPLKYSTGWKLATNESGKPGLLIAGTRGAIGDTITAYGAAIIELTHTLTNVPTMGQMIAVADAGLYTSSGTGLQDIGWIVEIDSDSLHSRALVFGGVVNLAVPGT